MSRHSRQQGLGGETALLPQSGKYLFSLFSTGDLEREKQRLQNILATGKDVVEHKPQQKPVQTEEEEIPEPDRFEERTYGNRPRHKGRP